MLQMPKRSLCDLVLDTIDIISARKNRPNLVRIYRHLHRLYDLSLSTCESLLQSLLKEGRVIRVTYKGNISYRNALKWKKYPYYMKRTLEPELPGTILTKAISELVVQEPDYLNMGVPCKILEEHLLSMRDDNINKETIHKLLQHELKQESLLQLDNGNYFLGPKPPETSLFDEEDVDLKFEKTKKVRTYKHDIKRLKDKNVESIKSSSFIAQNNILSEVTDLSDTEELKPNLTTDSSSFIVQNKIHSEVNELSDTGELKPSLTSDTSSSIEQNKIHLEVNNLSDTGEIKPNLTGDKSSFIEQNKIHSEVNDSSDTEKLKSSLTTDSSSFIVQNKIHSEENDTSDTEKLKPNLSSDKFSFIIQNEIHSEGNDSSATEELEPNLTTDSSSLTIKNNIHSEANDLSDIGELESNLTGDKSSFIEQNKIHSEENDTSDTAKLKPNLSSDKFSFIIQNKIHSEGNDLSGTEELKPNLTTDSSSLTIQNNIHSEVNDLSDIEELESNLTGDKSSFIEQNKIHSEENDTSDTSKLKPNLSSDKFSFIEQNKIHLEVNNLSDTGEIKPNLTIDSSSLTIQNNIHSEINDLSGTEELKPNLTTDSSSFIVQNKIYSEENDSSDTKKLNLNLTTDSSSFIVQNKIHSEVNDLSDTGELKPSLTSDTSSFIKQNEIHLEVNNLSDTGEIKPNLTGDKSSFIEQNKIHSVVNDLSATEELKSTLTTDIKCIISDESEAFIKPNESKNRCVDATLTKDDSSDPIIIKMEEETVEHSEDKSNNTLKNETVIDEKISEAAQQEKDELKGKLRLVPLEELVGTESNSSQAMDSEDSGSNLIDKNLNEEQCYNSPAQEENEEGLSLESSEDSFSLGNDDCDLKSSPLDRSTPRDVNLVKKEQFKLCDIKNDSEVNEDNISDSKQKSSPFKADYGSNGNSTLVNKVKRKTKRIQPVVERVQRKKRTKYDASEYYFPSLKRKTRESTESDKKEDKRRRKRKKDNGVGCLSGIFAKRVMFPGNTSMCCECNCYISKVKLDPMIFCSTCANQGHQSCALKTMTGTDWHCVGCRSERISPTCTACNKLANENDRGDLHFCARCGQCYHKGCHSLTTKASPSKNEWYCLKCSFLEDSSKKTNDSSFESVEKTNSESNESSIFQNERLANNTFQFLKEEPPDSKNWSAEEVYNYFKEFMDEEAAKAFMEQDIDGYALKLMGRNDVLNLGLKLGPSLKVLFHVRRLQLRSNSLVEIWNN